MDRVVLDAELHLVHRSPVDSSLAVVGVLLRAQAENVHFFSYLTALQKKVHAHNKPTSHLEAGDHCDIHEASQDDDEDEDEEGDENENENEEDDRFNIAAEYCGDKNETNFESQNMDADPDLIENNNNIDNQQDPFAAVTLAGEASASAVTASTEKCEPEPAGDICSGDPPTDEEATHIDLPLKPVDFSALVKVLGSFVPRREYHGSLTTPPCTEHVAWNAMHTSFPIGIGQLHALVDLQGYNARKINGDSESKRD
ncbi:hypothetical protein BGX29_003701 [Mortierella sp. GBA35]|nr:hypothetical protein BGX29_003701 [Mortierella sp. GBA35]